MSGRPGLPNVLTFAALAEEAKADMERMMEALTKRLADKRKAEW